MKRKQAAQLAAAFAALLLFFWIFLWSLPVLVAIVTGLAPFALAFLFLRWLMRTKPWSK